MEFCNLPDNSRNELQENSDKSMSSKEKIHEQNEIFTQGTETIKNQKEILKLKTE